MISARCLLSPTYVARALLCKAVICLSLLATPVQTMAQDGSVKLIAFGDSLTHGYGLPQGEGFVPQLQAWLTAQGQDVTVVNMGVSGDTTAGGKARLGWALGDGADALILELGGNDLLRGIDPADSRANLDAMMTELGDLGVPVLLAGLEAPLNYGPEFKEAFDSMYSELAAKHGAILYPSFVEGVVNADMMQDDGIHPNAKGVAVIVEGIGPKVLELLAQVRK